MGREENVLIFQDTEKSIKTSQRLTSEYKKSVSEQKLILEKDRLDAINLDIYDEPAKIIVSKKRTFEAAKAYRNNKVAVHNFASASNPGGGVIHGSTAQEECLCRCSYLYFCLNTPDMWDGFYTPHRQAGNPLHNDDIIYTPDVTVFKSDTDNPVLLPENEWYKVNVITCAAPNLRAKPSNKYNTGDGSKTAKLSDNEMLEIHEKRLRRILDVAVYGGNDTVILGAFGCGAFMNKANIVAYAAKNVIRDYLHAFKNIEFAVYCSPQDDSNYKTFRLIESA
ncbi:MAG: TIGR02452 family protein [Clostridium sp.]|nr:TIGR02452 family protein [Clostridium sp.]